MRNETPIADNFAAIIENPDSTERDAHRFLKEYPAVLYMLFGRSGNFWHIKPEFRFGTDFRADFAIISAHSGDWNVTFLELESPLDKVYTKERTPTKMLNLAIRQTTDWEEYTRKYVDRVKDEVSKVIRPLDVEAQNELKGRGEASAHDEILNPSTGLSAHSYVIIGNSDRFNDLQRHAHRQHSNTVATYKRIENSIRETELLYNSHEEAKLRLSYCGE